MNVSQRPGEITYYDELGVAHDASPEEIRDAFRSMARLLHPDQQTDSQLKQMAERQMRKLNSIYAVISDPQRRRDYDEDLADALPAPIIVSSAPPTDFRKFIGRGVWAIAIVFSAGILIWLSGDSVPAIQTELRIDNPDVTQLAKSSGNPVNSILELEQLRSDLRSVSAQRDAAIRELKRLQESAPPVAEAGPPPSRTPERSVSGTALTELRASPATGGPLPQRAEAQTQSRRLAGFWFYNKPAEGQKNKNQTLYPPEYIEATITEEGGLFRGRYRSRFRIVDRPISPDVNFSFGGAMNGATAICPWVGVGGAKGEMTLRFLSDNSIRIDWSATDLGSRQGLVSGTAVLTRKIEN